MIAKATSFVPFAPALAQGTSLDGLIRQEAAKLVEGRKHPRLVKNVRLLVGEEYLPGGSIQAAGGEDRENELRFLVSNLLKIHGVMVCDEGFHVGILTTEGIRGHLEFTAEFGFYIGEKEMAEIIRLAENSSKGSEEFGKTLRALT